MDSHGNSMAFYVTNRRHLVIEIDTKYHDPWLFHVIYPGFIFLRMLKHDKDFEQVQVMEFPWHLLRKCWDFHRIWSHFRPNRQPKTWENPCHIFTELIIKKTFNTVSALSTQYTRRNTLTLMIDLIINN